MKYFLCNWLGVINWEPKTIDEVTKDVLKPYWTRMDWFYVPEPYVYFDGIRYVYNSCAPRTIEIRTIEDITIVQEKLAKAGMI